MVKLNSNINGEALQPLFSSYLEESLRHDKCLHCKRPILPGTEVPRERLYPYELHSACINSFLQYWSVELLGDFKPVDDKFNTMGSSLILSIDEGLNEDIQHIILKRLAQSIIDAVPSGAVIRDSYISIEPLNQCTLQRVIRASVKVFPICMFCHGDRKLIGPEKYNFMDENTQIFPVTDTIKIEELVSTEDKAYVFHNSCLNNALNRFKCYHGGRYE
jgi:hypothetical protein